jgi:hypothetical protein
MFFSLRYFILLFTLAIVFVSCATSIRVYRPYPRENPYEVVLPQPKVSITAPTQYPERFASYDPYLFRFTELSFLEIEYNLQNEYGSLPYLIRKELSIRPDNFPNLLKEGGKIEIKEFVLDSTDRCWTNLVSVKMNVNVQIGRRPQETFFYQDQIESHVTDCFLLGSSIPILPLILYIPYAGFRGNREDQLNQLGRNAIESFFTFLENRSGYIQNSEKQIPIQMNPSKSNDPIRDPKIKEIMEGL